MNSLLFFSFLACFSGVFLGINRVLLGHLCGFVGANRASIINHLGGALFLLPIILCKQILDVSAFTTIPWYYFFGGVLGAVFTPMTSFLVPRLGVMKSTILFISGQLITSVFMDYCLGIFHASVRAICGIILIFSGLIIGEYQKYQRLSAG